MSFVAECRRAATLESRVVDMMRGGMTISEVVRHLEPHHTRNSVHGAASIARQKGRLPPLIRRRGKGDWRNVSISVRGSVAAALEPHARRRSLSVQQLIARLVDASPELIDAILDDRS